MECIIVNPKLVFNPSDKFTTGIVYLPIGIASISAVLNSKKIHHKIIDLFGNNPTRIKKENNFSFLGDDIEFFQEDIRKCKSIFLYANQVINHISIINILKKIKEINTNIKIFTFENTQAVTAYSLKNIANEFIFDNNDFVLIGEPEDKIIEIYKNLDSPENLQKIKGLIGKKFNNNVREIINDYENLPIPDWRQIPLKNYWNLKYAHGPFHSKKYLSILTSRGCPYPCKFCVVPETNDRKWRFKSPKKVVDELEFYNKNLNISEFHLEDLNPTVNEDRIVSICSEIIERNLNISWKIVAGTKVESIKKEQTVDLMAKSGCKYISISPESGSSSLMKKMAKPFDINHAIKIVNRMNQNKIYSQACFVLGYPGENDEDLKLTKKMIFNLARNGVDEIAIFIITPIPGSAIYDQITGYKNYSELNFSPTWRNDYAKLFKIRLMYYAYFIILKTFFYPIKVLKQIIRFCTLNFQTKMEMVPFKYLKLSFLSIFSKLNEKN